MGNEQGICLLVGVGSICRRKCVVLVLLPPLMSEQQSHVHAIIVALKFNSLQLQTAIRIRRVCKMAFEEEINTFTCSNCEKILSSESNLKTHLRIHTDDKPFNCSKCNHKSSTSCNLKTHERIHSGDKPFSYSQCNYKSSTNIKRIEIS